MQFSGSYFPWARLLQRIGFLKGVSKPTLEAAGRRLREIIVNNTPVDSGSARAGWTMPVVSGQQVSFRNTIPYITILDEGSSPVTGPWKKPGARTVWGISPYTGRRFIFSSQAPSGIIKPSLEQFNILKTVVAELRSYIMK